MSVLVYIESRGDNRDNTVKAVCDTFTTILREWVQRYTPSMTHNAQLPTSSGHVFNVR